MNIFYKNIFLLPLKQILILQICIFSFLNKWAIIHRLKNILMSYFKKQQIRVKTESQRTNIFPALIIKQTLSHKHNKHRKTSFLSEIQAAPSHCWKRVKIHPAPNQIKSNVKVTMWSGVSAVSAGDCLLSVWLWASVSGPQHLDCQPRRNAAAQRPDSKQSYCICHCISLLKGHKRSAKKNHAENTDYKCKVCNTHNTKSIFIFKLPLEIATPLWYL